MRPVILNADDYAMDAGVDAAILALSHQGTQQYERVSAKAVGKLVNIAGRQRMLSQRMATRPDRFLRGTLQTYRDVVDLVAMKAWTFSTIAANGASAEARCETLSNRSSGCFARHFCTIRSRLAFASGWRLLTGGASFAGSAFDDGLLPGRGLDTNGPGDVDTPLPVRRPQPEEDGPPFNPHRRRLTVNRQGGFSCQRLETGLEIRVPLFIKEGERVQVHTETREFAGRV